MPEESPERRRLAPSRRQQAGRGGERHPLRLFLPLSPYVGPFRRFPNQSAPQHLSGEPPKEAAGSPWARAPQAVSRNPGGYGRRECVGSPRFGFWFLSGGEAACLRIDLCVQNGAGWPRLGYDIPDKHIEVSRKPRWRLRRWTALGSTCTL